MPAKTSPRGRPKGSGLDDHGQLVAIAALIAKDPELKPTTAIKSLGISDPSTIRRLRDKYRKFQNSTGISKPEPKVEFDHQPKKSAKSTQRAQKLAAPATSKPELRPSRQPRSQKPMQTGSEASLGEPASWFNSWAAIGLQSLATTMDVQMAACRNLLALPPVAFAIEQQSQLNEMAISFYNQQKNLVATH